MFVSYDIGSCDACGGHELGCFRCKSVYKEEERRELEKLKNLSAQPINERGHKTTEGTIAAEEARKSCNGLCKKQRDQLYKEGLELFRHEDSSETLLLHMIGLSTRSVSEAILKYLDFPDCSHETRVAVFTHLQGDSSGY